MGRSVLYPYGQPKATIPGTSSLCRRQRSGIVYEYKSQSQDENIKEEQTARHLRLHGPLMVVAARHPRRS